MDNIFLSASVPSLKNGKDPVYHDTADFIAIREAVLGAATAILPDSCLVWGGHPSITYLIRELYKAIIGTDDDEKIRFLSKEHTLLYQSDWFRDSFPRENEAFVNVEFIPKKDTLPQSLMDMRDAMLSKDNMFTLALFIGGMDGVDREEFPMFRRLHPDVPAVPLPTTGAAALRIFNERRAYLKDVLDADLFERIQKDYAYINLVHDLISYAKEFCRR